MARVGVCVCLCVYACMHVYLPLSIENLEFAQMSPVVIQHRAHFNSLPSVCISLFSSSKKPCFYY